MPGRGAGDEPLGVLIAIPTLNEEKRIGDVIRQLLADVPPRISVRVLVVDGGSSDQTRAIVRRLANEDARIALIENPKRIQSAAINLAARQAEPHETVLIRADAHTDYPPQFVSRLTSTLFENQADSVVVPMDSIGRGCIGRAIAWTSDSALGSGGSRHRGGSGSGLVDHGHHAAWRTQSFDAVGGYDETFAYNEDAELDCRINAGGGRVWMAGDIRLTYHVRETFSRLARQYYNYGTGRARTMSKHPGSIRLRQAIPPTFVVSVTLALFLGLFWPIFLLLPAAYIGLLAVASVSMAVRRRSLCGLWAGASAAIMHFSWATGFIFALTKNKLSGF